ncbi:MAG: DUF362 domain-containing protein [Armatimonadota bacterium]
MSTPVYFGSAKQKRLRAEETLPAKLDRILERLNLRERVKGELVAIKMHLGGNIGYSTVHPVFVRKVVDAVKQGGGTPFVTDTPWAVMTAYQRGYSQETLGCPLIPAAGMADNYYKSFPEHFKNITEWKVAGEIVDASFLIDLAHAKGHPCPGYGGVFKNLALGCQVGGVRGAMHDTFHFDPYWFPEKCPDAETRAAIIAACPRGAIVQDRENEERLHLHMEPCNQCGRCLNVAPEGSLTIPPENFHAFQRAMALSTQAVLSTFAREKQVYLNLATQITPVCDCFGMTPIAILPDVGVFGGDDICAVEQASLDAMLPYQLIEENIPEPYEAQYDLPHPLQQLHGRYKDPYLVIRYGEELGLGDSAYTLVDVMDEAAVAAEPVSVSAAKL